MIGAYLREQITVKLFTSERAANVGEFSKQNPERILLLGGIREKKK